jgi:iron complex transport system ATP-binding protein
MIAGNGIRYAYDRDAVIDAVDVAASRGEVVGLIGPNGSGKTTLLKTLYGALRPQAGLVAVDNASLAELGPRAVARKIAVVVQESMSDLPFTVTDIVMLGRTPHLGSLQRYSARDRRAVAEAVGRVGVGHLAERIFAGLSGGEKQRVLIAKALAQEASHILLDEPTNHLDVHYQHEILHLVGGLEVTTVVVLHDLNLASRYCDRLVLLDGGRVVAGGTPDAVLVPEIIGPVYGIGVARIEHEGVPQLVFTRTSPTAAADPEVPAERGQASDRRGRADHRT